MTLQSPAKSFDLEALIEEPLQRAYGHLLSARTKDEKKDRRDGDRRSDGSSDRHRVRHSRSHSRSRSPPAASSTSSSRSQSNHSNNNNNNKNRQPTQEERLPMIELSDSQRDRRTVFVQQLSVRCEDRDLMDFFAKHNCPARQARLVIDKRTRRSKGVAYVEFFEEATVRVALKLTGTRLLGIPVIVELTETEKNRLAEEAAAGGAAAGAVSAGQVAAAGAGEGEYFRLHVGSLHPSLTELELERVFEPFGELVAVDLLRDEVSGTSRGVAFIQYKRSAAARAALEGLNGFELAGRAIRIGASRGDSAGPPYAKRPLPSERADGATVPSLDDEDAMALDPQKRAELMQKLSSRHK